MGLFQKITESAKQSWQDSRARSRQEAADEAVKVRRLKIATDAIKSRGKARSFDTTDPWNAPVTEPQLHKLLFLIDFLAARPSPRHGETTSQLLAERLTESKAPRSAMAEPPHIAIWALTKGEASILIDQLLYDGTVASQREAEADTDAMIDAAFNAHGLQGHQPEKWPRALQERLFRWRDRRIEALSARMVAGKGAAARGAAQAREEAALGTIMDAAVRDAARSAN